jgi:chemotaxis signal transduction protein
MQDELELEQFIVFRIDEYHLALPLDNILRVVEYSPQRGEKLSTMGLTQIGRYTIKVIDLHQALEVKQPIQMPERSAFLVVTHDAQGQPYGIPVYSPPDLVELPLRMMQALPPHDHRANILRIASHAAVISQDDVTTTVFLLDLTRTQERLQVERGDYRTSAISAISATKERRFI